MNAIILKNILNTLKNKIDNDGKTIFHQLAIKKELDLLFSCLYYKVASQNVRDKYGNVWKDYLELWEYEYIQQRYSAFKIGKILINEYKLEYSEYTPNGYTLQGVPILSIIWERDLGEELLKKVLESGVDLNNKFIRFSKVSEKYSQILARYGWVPDSPDEFEKNLPFIKEFYPFEQWNVQQIKSNYTVVPIEKVPKGYMGNKRITFISDTHSEHYKLNLGKGDILICSGDSQNPWDKSLDSFFEWFGRQEYTHKILVSGNHDRLIRDNKEYYLAKCSKLKITYLEDSLVEIDGLKIYGTPFTSFIPKNKNNAFTLNRQDLMKKWNLIPKDIDILVTHCPVYSVGDCNTDFYKMESFKGGDFGLFKTICRLEKLKIHCYGHQHFGRGCYKGSNGVYFINSAISYKKQGIFIN